MADKTTPTEEVVKPVVKKMLPPKESILDVLCTGLFIKGVITNMVFTFIANFFINFNTTAEKPYTWLWFGEETIAGVLFFFVLVPTLFTFMRGEIHKAIITGTVAPLSKDTLQYNVFTHNGLMYCCSIAGGWRRYIPFLLNGALFPGLAVVGGLMAACQSYPTGVDMEGKNICALPQIAFVSLDASWKAVSVVILYTMHFIACHNENEPELRAALLAEGNSAEGETAEDKKNK